MKKCNFIVAKNECNTIESVIKTEPSLKFFDALKFIKYIDNIDILRTYPQHKNYGFIRTFMSFIQEEGGKGPLPPNEAYPEAYDSIDIIQDRVPSGHDCYPGNFYFTIAKDPNEYCEEMILKIKWRDFFIPKGEYKIKVAFEENKPIISTYILRDLRFKQEDLPKVLSLDKMLYEHVLTSKSSSGEPVCGVGIPSGMEGL